MCNKTNNKRKLKENDNISKYRKLYTLLVKDLCYKWQTTVLSVQDIKGLCQFRLSHQIMRDLIDLGLHVTEG